jgi:hypothetical protein
MEATPPPMMARSENPTAATAARAAAATDRERYVHGQVNLLDSTITSLHQVAGAMEDRLGQVLRQDMPNSIMGDADTVTEAPPDVPLANRIATMNAQAQVTLCHLQSLLDRLEV